MIENALRSNMEIRQYLGSLGLRMFELPYGKKAPPPKGWQEIASTDPSNIPEHCNIGIATGKGLLVLDFDVPKAPGQENGLKTLAEWDAKGLPQSLRVRTPSGGVHVYLKYPPDLNLKNSVKKIAPGVDVRADGGYVVGPGSVIADLNYSFGSLAAHLSPFLAH